MPRVHKVKSARKDIYSRGTRIDNPKTKKGYTLDRSIPADKDDVLIVPKGTTYYWWQFAFGTKRISLQYPPRTATTQSAFYQEVWGLEDGLDWSGYDEPEDLETYRDEIVMEIQGIQDETVESLGNMPDSLQESPTGELLQERIEALEDWRIEFESIDLDYDDDQEKSEWMENKIEELSNITCEA